MNDRENPFASHCIQGLAFRFPPGWTFETVMKRLADQQHVGAIVGRHGSGKTLLLEALIPYLREAGFEPKVFRLSNESSMRSKEQLCQELRRVVKPGFILLDGAEQLSTRLWLPVRAAASQAAGFIVSVHRVSRLPVLFECETTAGLLQDLVEELTHQELPYSEADALMIRHHGNVRDCFRELHERWAGAEVVEE